MWSTDLYLVALLDEYVGSKPVVADYVREQLLREDERNAIGRAIDSRREGRADPDGQYDCWLRHSGIDFTDEERDLANAIAGGHLLRALFDLTLGRSIRTRMLNNYTEFREVRRAVRAVFFMAHQTISLPDLDRLWWDEAYISKTPEKRWISIPLKSHSAFLPILESWLKDSEYLQTWLTNYEAETPIVNNPRSTVEKRAFSGSTAVELLKFVKVGVLRIFRARISI